MKMKKFFCRVLMFLVVLGIGFGIFSLADKLTGPKDVKLESGWQLIEINGIVPKGAVLIVSDDSDTILPNEHPETRGDTGYVTQGRVNFYMKYWVITKAKVWAYYPPKTDDFLVKRNDFVTECQQKLSDLTDGEGILVNEYDVGHQ